MLLSPGWLISHPTKIFGVIKLGPNSKELFPNWLELHLANAIAAVNGLFKSHPIAIPTPKFIPVVISAVEEYLY